MLDGINANAETLAKLGERILPQKLMPWSLGTAFLRFGAMKLRTVLLILGLAAIASPVAAGPLTFNTALPVSQGEGILRGDAMVLRGSSGLMDQDVTGLAFPFVLGYGLTRDLTLFAVAPMASTAVSLANSMLRPASQLTETETCTSRIFITTGYRSSRATGSSSG